MRSQPSGPAHPVGALEVPVQIAHTQQLDPYRAPRSRPIDRAGGRSNAKERDKRGSNKGSDSGGQMTVVHAGT
jgi:hypothetical protein